MMAHENTTEEEAETEAPVEEVITQEESKQAGAAEARVGRSVSPERQRLVRN